MTATRLGSRRGLSLAAVALLAVSGVLGGCGMFGGGEFPVDDDVAAAPVLSRPLLDVGYSLRWIRNAPTNGVSVNHVAFLPSGDLAVGDADNIVRLLEGSSGRTRWTVPASSPLLRMSGLAWSEFGIIVLMQTEFQLLDERDGVLVNRHATGVQASTVPLVRRGGVVFGSRSGRVLSLDIRDGYQRWAYDLAGQIRTEPTLVGDSAVFISTAGQVATLAMSDGSSRGRRVDLFGGSAAAAATDGERIYIASLDQSFWGISVAVDGGVVWRKRTDIPLRSTPAAFERVAYLDVPGRGLVAFEGPTGDEVWTNAELSGTVLGLHGGQLVVWSGAEEALLSLLDPRTGRVVEDVALEGVIEIRTPTFDGGDLYLFYADGRIERYAGAR